MATYTLLSDGAVRNLLAGASPECGDFTMKCWMDVFPEHFFSSAGEHTDALIIQASFPMCHAQDLMLDLEAADYCPAIILFTIMPDGSIQYVLSDETVLPLSEQLAAYFEEALNHVHPCRRVYYRSAVWREETADTFCIQSERQNALNELLLGCTHREIQYYRERFGFDFRDRGYHLFFWELNFMVYVGHRMYKDVYNMIGTTMKRQCEEVLAQYNGGEVFYIKLTQVCIVINDLHINSEVQKRAKLNAMLKQLAAVVGSQRSICYFSNRVKSISDFRTLYNRYLSERNVSFFTKEKQIIQSASLPKIKDEVNADEINDVLNQLSRYISYDIANAELDNTLRHLFFNVLKCSMNMPMYYYCLSVIGSVLRKVYGNIDEVVITDWLDSDRLRHSSIEEEYEALSRIIQAVRIKQNGVRQARTGTLLNSAIDYINAHYQENITISAIAEKLYVSETYLSRIFKNSLNISIIQYLIHYRIKHAKVLLERTDYPVYMVAAKSGFRDVRNFSKTFKKQTGLTPTEFRKQY